MIPVVFPDPILVALALLRDRLPDYTADTVTAGSVQPDIKVRGGSPLPYLAVTQDTPLPGRYPALEVVSLRVGVWHTSAAKSLALAQRARAVLVAYEGGSQVRSFRGLLAPNPSTDPDSGSPLSYFTVAARLRPTAL